MAFRMSRTSMKLTLGEDNRDYTYYRDHGWFDSDYYYPTRVGPLKRAVGATFDLDGSPQVQTDGSVGGSSAVGERVPDRIAEDR